MRVGRFKRPRCGVGLFKKSCGGVGCFLRGQGVELAFSRRRVFGVYFFFKETE